MAKKRKKAPKKPTKAQRVVSNSKKKSRTTHKPSSPTKDTKKPSTDGKFKPGNKASKGATGEEIKHRLKLAYAFKSAIEESDMIAIAKKLVKEAKAGNVKAAKEVLDRCLGKAKEIVEWNLGDETLQTVLGVINGSTKGKLPADDSRDSSNTS